MTLERAIELILGNLGTLVLLLAILYGGMRGWWVFGRYYGETRADLKEQIRKLEARLERAERVASAGTGLAQHATSLAERTAEGHSKD
jgi:hypothetical protein